MTRPPTDPAHPDHPAARIARLERLADNMDSRFRVPGTRIRFGWDAVLSIVPGLGDTAALAPAGWIMLEAHRMGAPNDLLARMAANVGIDWVVGSIPVLGTLLDVGLKANRRNVALLKAHFGKTEPRDAADLVELGGAPPREVHEVRAEPRNPGGR